MRCLHFRRGWIVTLIRPALRVTDANVFSTIGESVPVFRSRSAGKDEWLTPADLIYDKTAGVIRRQQGKLAGIADSFQAIVMHNLLRIALKQIILACKDRQAAPAMLPPEVVEQIITPHFRRNDVR